MRTWDEPKKRKAHIELIPMIDVMMFLLVFFVLVSLNVIPALGMKTQLPSASSSQQFPAVEAAEQIDPDLGPQRRIAARWQGNHR
ncbi:TonB system transport protein [Pseudomonas syringae pv. primulae]|uniref:TonB system transport protein n=1 Tax=Pseudomonas syringae pv. primulae TaxID=251707 RepID=A0A3M4S679_9PSED|nr:TonB system transport protein [Pseudomonas syringae pv. primulae]